MTNSLRTQLLFAIQRTRRVLLQFPRVHYMQFWANTRTRSNRVTYNNAIEDAICWKITLPQRERGQVLQRLESNEHQRLYTIAH